MATVGRRWLKIRLSSLTHRATTAKLGGHTTESELKSKMFEIAKTVVIGTTLAMVGCSSFPTGADRTRHADELALANNWRSQLINTSEFSLRAYTPPGFDKESPLLRIYIEGDGLSWISRSRASSDPTPLKPVALMLAMANTDANAAYLARPCQFDGRAYTDCKRHYWTSGRFSRSVIQSMNEAVNDLKKQSGAASLELVGFSGGGAIGLLLAAQRDDVVKLITVAGNLDTDRWTEYHRISPLKDSLNPANYIKQLRDIQQVHYVGELDSVIPPQLTKEFVSLLGPTATVEMIVAEGFDHHCCWKRYQFGE